MTNPNKVTASSTEAGIKVQGAAVSHLSNKCFLCPNEIGEAEPRGFYQGKNAMLLAHRSCLNVFEAAQRVSEGSVTPPPSGVNAVGQDGPPPAAPAAPAGPARLWFETFDSMQGYILKHGPIPDEVAVSLNDMVLRDAR